MGVSYNPNDPGRVLSGIGQFIQGLRKFNNPDEAQNEALLSQVQSNPDIAQHLAYQLKQNPNAFDSLNPKFFGSNKVLDYLKSVKLDPSYEFKQNEAQDMLKLQGTQKAMPDLAAAGLPGVPTMSGDVKRQYDEYRAKALGIKSPTEEAATVANTKESLARASAFESENAKREEGKKADLAADALLAQKGIKPDAGLYNYVNPYASGVPPQNKFSQSEIQTIYNSPTRYKQLQDEERAYWANQSDRRQRDITAENINARKTAKQDNFYTLIASQIHTQSQGRVLVQPSEVEQYANLPQAERDKLLTLKPNEVPPQLLKPYAVSQAIQTMRDEETKKDFTIATKNLNADVAWRKVMYPAKGTKITDEDIANANAAAARAFASVRSIPAPELKLSTHTFGKDKAVQVEQVTKDPLIQKEFGGIEDKSKEFDALPQEEKAARYNKIGSKYPGETQQQILARLKAGEK